MKRLGLLLTCVLLAAGAWAGEARVRAVDAIGMTVSDLDRSVDFYARVLGFTPGQEVEVTSEAYEQLRGVFPLRMRVVRLRPGKPSAGTAIATATTQLAKRVARRINRGAPEDDRRPATRSP